MPGKILFANRRLHVCYWDSESRFSSAEKMQLEQGLRRLADLDFAEIKTLNDPKFSKADLLIIAAQHVQDEQFSKWLEKLVQNMHHPSSIWVPALIVSPIGFDEASDALRKYLHKNWYFDTVRPDHFDSIPIRIANLVRIHDHLKELRRYDEQLKNLAMQMDQLEQRLKTST